MTISSLISFFFFFNDTATTEIYPLSLHDALPISRAMPIMTGKSRSCAACHAMRPMPGQLKTCSTIRSEEHTSELQSLRHLVCRLLLEKKKKKARKDHLILARLCHLPDLPDH